MYTAIFLSCNISCDADTTLVNMFLLTYRSFVTSHDLLTLLMARYAAAPKNNFTVLAI
jgi:hypothetical protein